MRESRKKILGQIYDWTLTRTTGGLLIGAPSVGKSTIIYAFQNLFGKVLPIFVVRSTWYNKNINVSKKMIDCFQRSFDFKTNRISLRHIVNHYIEKASEMKSNYVVTFLDDVSNWSIYHYYWLINLQNELAAKNLQSSFYLQVQPN